MVNKVEEEYKKLVRKKLRVKRVTKRAQQNVWEILNQKTRNKFGGWKPGNVPKKSPVRKVTPAPKKSPVRKVTPAPWKSPTPKAGTLEFWLKELKLAKKSLEIGQTTDKNGKTVNYKNHIKTVENHLSRKFSYYVQAPTIALKSTNVCVLGKGAYGKVCMRESSNGSKYAVKTSLYNNSVNKNNLLSEKSVHMDFYYKLPQALRKYFPKPVNVKGESFAYAMTMFDGMELSDALRSPKSTEYKRNVIKNLRKAIFALWTSGYIHGDIHTGNIMVSEDTRNPQIQILDFGMMRKSALNVPNKKFKTNTIGYKNLNDRWHKWFVNSWKVQLNKLGLNTANPNMIVFPRKMGNIGYYARGHVSIFNNLNRYGNKSPSPPVPKSKGLAKERLEKYKQLVRKRMKVKRVTKKAQIDTWDILSKKNREQFGSWKPEGVIKHHTTPPKRKSPTPKKTIDSYLSRALMDAGGRVISNETLLRFWMTHYTQAQKKAIYKLVSDPEKAQRDYPLCK